MITQTPAGDGKQCQILSQHGKKQAKELAESNFHLRGQAAFPEGHTSKNEDDVDLRSYLAQKTRPTMWPGDKAGDGDQPIEGKQPEIAPSPHVSERFHYVHYDTHLSCFLGVPQVVPARPGPLVLSATPLTSAPSGEALDGEAIMFQFVI
jgi:hypothetical protein